MEDALLAAAGESAVTVAKKQQLVDSVAQQWNLGSGLSERVRPCSAAIDEQLGHSAQEATPEVYIAARLLECLTLGGAGQGSQGVPHATAGAASTFNVREENVPIAKLTGTLDKHITCLRTWFDVLITRAKLQTWRC